MRKDVILGMSIGGVMLAIVIVYLTVSPSGKSNKNLVQVDNGGIVEGAGGVGDAQDSSGVPEAAPPAAPAHVPAGRAADAPRLVEPSVPAKPMVIAATAVEKNDGTWGHFLYNTPLISTATPDRGGAADSAGDQSSVVSRPGHIEGQIPMGDPLPRTGPESSATPSGASATAQPSGKMGTHKIAANETFSTIAATFYGSANYYPHIQRANPKVDPTHLKIGMVINLPDRASVIPSEKPASKTEGAGKGADAAEPAARRSEALIDSTREYRVASGDSLYKIAIKLYGKSDMVDKIYDLNKASIGPDRAKLKLGMLLKLPQPPAVKQ